MDTTGRGSCSPRPSCPQLGGLNVSAARDPVGRRSRGRATASGRRAAGRAAGSPADGFPEARAWRPCRVRTCGWGPKCCGRIKIPCEAITVFLGSVPKRSVSGAFQRSRIGTPKTGSRRVEFSGMRETSRTSGRSPLGLTTTIEDGGCKPPACDRFTSDLGRSWGCSLARSDRRPLSPRRSA